MLNIRNIYISLVGVHIVVLILFNKAVFDLYYRWQNVDDSISHGIIIFIISVYIYYSRIGNIKFSSDNIKISCFFLTFLSIICSLSIFSGINIIEYVSLWLILLVLQFALFSYNDAKYISPSILYLIFSIPVWDYLNPYLVDLSSAAISFFVTNTDMVALVEDSVISLPFGKLEISGGCSGLNYLIISVALATFILLTSEVSLIVSCGFVLLSIILALIFNWFRIYLLVLIAYKTEMQSSLIYDHSTFGWLLFGIVILILVSISIKLTTKYNDSLFYFKNNETVSFKKLTLIILTLLSGPVLMSVLPANYQEPNIANLELSDNDFEPLSETSNSNTSGNTFKLIKKWKQKYNNFPLYVSVSINWRAKDGDELVPYIEKTEEDNNWNTLRTKEFEIDRSFNLKQAIQENRTTGQKRVSLYWFSVGNVFNNNYTLIKLLQIPEILIQKNSFSYYQIDIICEDSLCQNEMNLTLETANKIYELVKNEYGKG